MEEEARNGLIMKRPFRLLFSCSVTHLLTTAAAAFTVCVRAVEVLLR